ncbi:HNH endonuclease [Candidatus Puniceispirillum sp.]|uniref:HNH endonuclease n=1 Tax=Candidatus Puniceispirillum sp. TaxID=2026719 RepID=UPI003F69CE2F
MASNATNNNEKEHIDDTETQSADDMIDELIDPNDLITKAEEGKKKLVSHYVRERSSKLRKCKLQKVIKEHGHLKCECCDTTGDTYLPEIRKRVFEVHHKIPLADIDTKIEMTVDDLALLCANCHRAIHATNPLLSVEEFKNILGY